MLLLIQIALAVAVWKKGWRWKALLPFAVAYGCAFLVGMAVGASGGSIDQALPVFVLLDIGALVALIVLVRREPAKPPVSASPEKSLLSGETSSTA